MARSPTAADDEAIFASTLCKSTEFRLRFSVSPRLFHGVTMREAPGGTYFSSLTWALAKSQS